MEPLLSSIHSEYRTFVRSYSRIPIKDPYKAENPRKMSDDKLV